MFIKNTGDGHYELVLPSWVLFLIVWIQAFYPNIITNSLLNIFFTFILAISIIFVMVISKRKGKLTRTKSKSKPEKVMSIITFFSLVFILWNNYYTGYLYFVSLACVCGITMIYFFIKNGLIKFKE